MQAVPAEGRTLELVIESLASSGEGVARAADGLVVFVELAAPSDRVRVCLHEEHPRFARGRVTQLLESGPGRTEFRLCFPIV